MSKGVLEFLTGLGLGGRSARDSRVQGLGVSGLSADKSTVLSLLGAEGGGGWCRSLGFLGI